MEIEKVMNRQKVADSIHKILEIGVGLLEKEKITQDDHAKMKLMKTLASPISAAVVMVQQETAQLRAQIVIERMKQLGFNVPKQLDSIK